MSGNILVVVYFALSNNIILCIVRTIKERSAVIRMLKVSTKERSFIDIIIIVSRILFDYIYNG